MRFTKVWQKLLGVESTVVEEIVFDDEEEVIVASVRPRKGATRRCGLCQQRCPRYDNGEGRRRWRTLDLGSIPTYLEADAPRVGCPVHGVVVASVPWARHGAGHTRGFDDQVAWLATHCSLEQNGGTPGCSMTGISFGLRGRSSGQSAGRVPVRRRSLRQRAARS